MNKPNSALRKYVKLRKILKNRLVTRAVKYIGVAFFSLSSQGSALENDDLPGSLKDDKKIDRSEWRAEAIQKQLLSEEIDIEAEIDKRADWFVKQYVDTLKGTLNEIKQIKTYKPRREFINKNFFTKVYEAGDYKGPNFYCIAAAMSCLRRLNDETGDLDNFFPDGTTEEAHVMVSCPSFAKFIKGNYKDCIKEYIYGNGNKMTTKKGEIFDVSELKEGMILLQSSAENTSSGWHAVTYIGEGKVLSFNRDGTYNVQKNVKTKVIDMPEIVRREWRQKMREIQNHKDVKEPSLAMFTELYVGRENEFLANFKPDSNLGVLPEMVNYQPVALELAPKLSEDARFKHEVLELPKGEDNLVMLKEKRKTIIPWKVFAGISGKNLDS